MFIFVLELCAFFVLCFGQNQPVKGHQNGPTFPTDLHNSFSEASGNFSVELLYHAAKSQGKQNLIVSPFTAWTVLVVTSEGALGNTRRELVKGLRIYSNRAVTRQHFQETARWLAVNTTTVQFSKFNGIFLDKSKLLEEDFRQSSKAYGAETFDLDFSNTAAAAATINGAISSRTKGRIPKLIEESSLSEAQMIITSAVYFKGQWTAPFNVSYTAKQNFFNSTGSKIGEVNMMYNRYIYPFANIKEIQARVIELPYGKENRLSMLLMLPNPGVTLEDMFLNFKTVPLDTVFHELKLSQEEYGDDEIDCFIPRFKIESTLELNDILKSGMGIYDLFDPIKANLGHLARVPMYVTKVVHKAEIEVTEEGTTASGATAAEFANRIGAIRFEVNRPFSYLIVEKVTNTIVFGGVYQQPVLY